MEREEILAYAKQKYGTTPEYPWRDWDYAVLRRADNRKWYGLLMRVERKQLGIAGAGDVEILNVKCDPDVGDFLRRLPGVLPGYHMNKKRWLSLLLEGGISEDQMLDLLDDSYALTAARKQEAAMKNRVVSGIRERLYALQDKEYQTFQQKLIPTVLPEKIIGVRMPSLRVLAKEIPKNGEAEAFLEVLPHNFLEEYLLHGILLGGIKDFSEAVRETERFLPYIDNWAVCDLLSPKVFGKKREELLPWIDRWLSSGQEYTVRFGMKMLMSHYLEEMFRPEYPEKIIRANTDALYVKLMAAWYFATALAKQYEAVLPLIEAKQLDRWTHNKAIQKSLESYRISEERKMYLRTLRMR